MVLTVIESPPEVLSKLSNFDPIVLYPVGTGENRTPSPCNREWDQLMLVELLKVVSVRKT